jgi:alginate O-acetyltransferase complex protein AlgI
MLFTSPVFLFLFLPVIMTSYIIIPKRHKRRALLVYNVLFLLCANFHRPVNLLLLVSVILLTYATGVSIKKEGKARTLIAFVSLMVFSLLLVRMISSLLYIIDFDYYPLGLSVYVLSAISYIADVYRGDAEPGSFFDVALYMSFFPLLVCGPFVKYKDFAVLTSEEEIKVSAESFSSGIILFAFGFVKKIGISAVLVDTYEKLIPIGENGYSSILLFVISSLMFIAIYFGFSGYSDMASGLSHMLGIHIENDGNNVFVTLTSPSRYMSSFLRSLGAWTDDYVRQPIIKHLTSHAKDEHSQKFITFVSSFIRALCICAWFKSTPPILLIIVPLAIAVAAEDTFLHGRRFMRSRLVYIPSAIITFIILSFFWAFMKDGGIDRFVYDLAASSLVGYGEQLYEMLTSLFSTKTLLSLTGAALCLLASIGSTRSYIRNASTGKALALRTVASALVLVAFLLCIIIYLPQYPIYSTVPFKDFAM